MSIGPRPQASLEENRSERAVPSMPEHDPCPDCSQKDTCGGCPLGVEWRRAERAYQEAVGKPVEEET